MSCGVHTEKRVVVFLQVCGIGSYHPNDNEDFKHPHVDMELISHAFNIISNTSLRVWVHAWYD